MWLTAKTSGVPGQNGLYPADGSVTDSRTTRYLSAAAHLRRPMLPDQITDPGTTTPRRPLPVGRAYALRMLYSAGGVIPVASIDVRQVRKHCLLALLQTTVRDLAALGVVAACFAIDPWGTGITLGILAAVVIFAGQARFFLPLLVAAMACLAVTVFHGSPAERVSLGTPLACLAACFAIYLLDVLLSIRHVRRILRRPPAREKKRPLQVRAPDDAEYQRWLYGDGRNGNGNGNGNRGHNGHNGNGRNGYRSYQPDQDGPGDATAAPAPGGGPVRVYYGRNGIIGSGVPLRTLPLTLPLAKPLDADRDTTAFSTSDLMEAIAGHLRSQSAADVPDFGYAYKPVPADGPERAPQEPHFSYGVPNLEVVPVVATPVPEPVKIPGAPLSVVRLNYRDLPSGDEMLNLANRSPSEGSERHYMRASTSSWDGQLVASVYVSVALQGHYLRVIMRPYVLAPLVFDLKAADDLARWHPLILACLAVSVTIRGFLNTAGKLNRVNTESAEADRAGPPKTGLRSMRESYARPYVNNIHQQEDCNRLIQIIEQKVLNGTMDYLRNHNIDVEEYERQVQSIVQSYTILGDGNINAGTFTNSAITSMAGQGNSVLSGQPAGI